MGLLVGTLSAAGRKPLLASIKQLCRRAGRKYYVFVMGKLNEAKLANFMEVRPRGGASLAAGHSWYEASMVAGSSGWWLAAVGGGRGRRSQEAGVLRGTGAPYSTGVKGGACVLLLGAGGSSSQLKGGACVLLLGAGGSSSQL